ncbi:hypothetical protein [Streptomyces sp. DW26H14]|uniref:hypothetical protein n=1 Tax=Streptomyces sp. DW26H14 TaxID=3435395 RepID=UPI00403D6833
MPTTPPATRDADLRTAPQDAAELTPEEWDRVHGHACVRCGSRGGLRPGGYAQVLMGGGTYGYPVRVCSGCPTW